MIWTIICFVLMTANAESKFRVYRNPPPKGFKSSHVSGPSAEISAKETRVSVWACGTYIGVVGPTSIYDYDNKQFVKLVDEEIERACEKEF